MLESYEYGVIDYLLKPISLPRFIKSMERYLSLYQNEETEEPLDITIKVDGRNMELKMDDIDYIQSYGNFVKVFTQHKIHLVSTTTQEILSTLSARKFMRIHKSYIVNLSKIATYSESEIFINNEKLPIGITYKRELLEFLGKPN